MTVGKECQTLSKHNRKLFATMGRIGAIVRDPVGLAHLSIVNKCGRLQRGGGGARTQRWRCPTIKLAFSLLVCVCGGGRGALAIEEVGWRGGRGARGGEGEVEADGWAKVNGPAEVEDRKKHDERWWVACSPITRLIV
jgi:hypothetical protein